MNNIPSQETTYDFSRFTDEDRKMYMNALLDLPYNPEWAQFFYDQKKELIHQKNIQHKHAAKFTPEFYEDILMSDVSPEEIVIQKETILAFHNHLQNLSETELRRLLLHDVGHMSYEKIASEECVKYRTVRNCVQNARSRIVNSM